MTPHQALRLAVLGAILAIGYWISLRARPYVTCRRCRGTGKVRGSLFAWARDFCWKCGGTGLVPRLGTYLCVSARRAGPARGQYR
jgi:hypothetical protein